MIPPSFIQDLLARVDIVDVVGRHVELKRTGANFVGLCPFHGEKSPSFTVTPSKQFFHCFGCGAHGNAIDFLMEHLGLGFVEAVEDLAQQCGLAVPRERVSEKERDEARALKEKQSGITDLLERAAEHYRAQLKASPRAIEYLKGRGLTGKVAARFGLGYAPDGWRSLAGVFPHYDDPALVEAGLVITQGDDPATQKRYDRFRDRVMFPIRSVQGQVIGFGGRVLDKGEPKYLNSPETPVFVKGRELYGLFEARTALRERGYCLVVEGYMDVVALAQLGFANAVATLGTACTGEHVHKLLRFTDTVVFSFDGDAAGRRAALRAMEASLPHATDLRTFRFLFLPPEHDPDSFVREFGPEAFDREVSQAIPLSRQLLDAAAADCDLDTAEGRARLLAQARPYWQALPDGALKRQLLGELAAQARLDAAELRQMWAEAPGARRPRGTHSPDAQADGFDPHGAAAENEPRSYAQGPQGDRPGGRRSGPWRRDPDREARLRQGPPLRSPIRSPADQVVRMALLHSEWWHELTHEQHEALCALPTWHGGCFRWLDRWLGIEGPCTWSTLREAAGTEPWAQAAVDLLEGGDIQIPPLQEEFAPAVEKAVRASEIADANRVLGR